VVGNHWSHPAETIASLSSRRKRELYTNTFLSRFQLALSITSGKDQESTGRDREEERRKLQILTAVASNNRIDCDELQADHVVDVSIGGALVVMSTFDVAGEI
jgi:hypothetical protein